MKDLNNKIIIVTGANGLIGREIVHELEEHEATVIAADIAFETSKINGRKRHLNLTLARMNPLTRLSNSRWITMAVSTDS